jgi:Rod binding domain-containing protein
MAIVNQLSSHTYELAKAPQAPPRLRVATNSAPQSVADAQAVHDAFSSFIGETFYGQMMKSMRTTLEKPAYFHGGHAEEMFQSQLDQQLAQEWAEQSGDRFAEPMFEQQFPQHAKVLREARQQAAVSALSDLNALRRL